MGALSRGRRPAGDKSVTDHAFSAGPDAAGYWHRDSNRPSRGALPATDEAKGGTREYPPDRSQGTKVHRLNRVEQVDPHHDQGRYAGSRYGVEFC